MVLGSSPTGAQHPPRAGAASWVTENPRGSSPGQPVLEGLSEKGGRSFHSLAKLVLAFLGCRPFARGWQCWVLLCGGVASPEGKQARAGKAPAVVGFQHILRPALQDGRQPQAWQEREGEEEGVCTGKHSFLMAGVPVSSLRHGEYSTVAYPFFSPVPNTGTLSLLQIHLFYLMWLSTSQPLAYCSLSL